MTGTVVRKMQDKGFGFVKDERGQEYFFHRTGVASTVRFDDLREGDAVTFETEDSAKGPRATRISLA